MNEPPETLTRDAVTLRRWRYGDEPVVYRICMESLDHLIPWMPWAPGYDRSRADEYIARCEQNWRSGETYDYAITTGGDVVGSCGLMRRIGPGGLEIGYWLHPAYTGRGLVTMAAGALADAALVLDGIDHVEIHHDEANAASGAVPRRLGFTEVVRYPDQPLTAPGQVGVSVVWRRDRG